ncbi:DMT family transporter [Candidatus Thorarchaeota archaeon]|nr:MAG: DMT family transporter [Candidatus Thorarchaeota archaeon]
MASAASVRVLGQSISFKIAMQLTPDLLLGSLAGLLSAALYAFSVVVYRSRDTDIRPIAISSYKMWVSLLFMSVIVILPFGASLSTLTMMSVILLSLSVIVGAVIGDTVYLMSQEIIGVSYAFPLAMSYPILTNVFTSIFLNEQLILGRFTGAIVTVVGTIILSREQGSQAKVSMRNKRPNFVGLILAFLTSLFYAGSTTILQVGVTDVDPISGNFIRVLAGSVAFVPIFTWAKRGGMEIPTKGVAKAIAFAGIFGMGISSLFYVTAVKLVGAGVTSVLASTAPLFAVPASVFCLKENLTRLGVLGVLATILGVILVILSG